jgi:hypothetical protein
MLAAATAVSAAAAVTVKKANFIIISTRIRRFNERSNTKVRRRTGETGEQERKKRLQRRVLLAVLYMLHNFAISRPSTLFAIIISRLQYIGL